MLEVIGQMSTQIRRKDFIQSNIRVILANINNLFKAKTQ